MSVLAKASIWVLGGIALIVVIGIIGGIFDKRKKERDLKRTIQSAIEDSAPETEKMSTRISMFTQIVGVTKNSDEGVNIQNILPELEVGSKLTFIREPKNIYDTNAIKVICDYQHIGYLKSSLAEEIAPIMDSGKELKGYIKQITGGTDGKTYGCNIHISI